MQKWFEKYYLPSVQKRRFSWQKMLPVLRKNSYERIAENAEYQDFLNATEDGKSVVKSDGDIQLDEAKNILKDMIYLSKSTADADTK
jgi:carboxyl-terminal processing protease